MKKVILVGIILMSLALRVYKLGVRPLGFTWDEAALGYNAYSLLKTGRDEYGKVLPPVLKSFGDYKPGLYAYFAVPPIAIFGLNEFATRLPSAIIGTLFVIVVYLLVKELIGIQYSLATAFVIAINPWHLMFSRGAWETNICLFLTTLGTLLFIRRRYILSALFFGLTFLAYQGAKMFTPLLLLSLIYIYRPVLKSLIIPGCLLFLLALPIILGLSYQSGRLKVFSVFSYTRTKDSVQGILRQDNVSTPNLVYNLFHSELLDQGRGILQRYLNHFSPYYLFFAGDWQNPRHTIAYYGYFHLFEIVTILIGLYWLIKHPSPSSTLIFIWLALAPLPSALSRDLVSGIRSLPELLPLVIISGIGLSHLLRHRFLVYPFVLVALFSFAYYLDLFYIHSPNFNAIDYVYPYGPVIKILKNHLDEYQHVIFSDKLGQPYIFTLFYLQIDPKQYQLQSRLIENPQGDVGHIDRFKQFEFRPLFLPADRGLTSTILIGDQYELPQSDLQTISNLTYLGEVKYPNGAPGLKIVGLK